MSTMKCFEKSSFEIQGKFSSKKILKLLKMAKPILKLMTKKRRTNAVTPSTCNYDVEESFQNDVNESELFQLNFKFFDEKQSHEAEENSRNEELERRLLRDASDDGQDEKLFRDYVVVRPATPAPFPGLVSCKLFCAPPTDIDIRKRGGGYATGCQVAERQVAVAAV